MRNQPQTTTAQIEQKLIEQIDYLNQIGISLSRVRQPNLILEQILMGAKLITHADGGTLYLVNPEKQELHFTIVHNDSLGIDKGGTSEDQDIDIPPIPLTIHDGIPNTSSVASCVAVSGVSVNIPDAYELAGGFNFVGLKKFDKANGYKTHSILTIPMTNHENDTIGVLQLINARDQKTGEVCAFNQTDIHLAESLASQAAVTLTNNLLIGNLRNLIERFIEVIAGAIDEKSPYTGGHCRRVPDLAMMMADAVNAADNGPLKQTVFDPDELYELKIAALLHDCGKITTPIHVVDKATKLETIFDRIELINHRFEILRRDLEIGLLKKQINGEADNAKHFQQQLEQLAEDQAFLQHCNKGSEFMDPAAQQRLEQIASRSWTDASGHTHALLDENELANLQISKGTLTEEERTVINNHIVMTQRMLSGLPFPRYLQNVPEIAGNHHERMDGKGYPNGLNGEQMSVRARIMCIADVFEALTAADRPYKQPMALSTALGIMEKMTHEGHLDPDLYKVFVEQQVHLRYGEKFLRPEQLDLPVSSTQQRKSG